MTPDQLAWLECQGVGCDAGMAVDSRHVANLTAAGGWHCRDHHQTRQTNDTGDQA